MRIQDFEVDTSVVAKALKCSRQNISAYVKKGRLIPSGKKGNTFVFKISELAKVMPPEKYARVARKLEESRQKLSRYLVES